MENELCMFEVVLLSFAIVYMEIIAEQNNVRQEGKGYPCTQARSKKRHNKLP